MSTREEMASQAIDEITSAFTGISREGGVSLHETRVLDDCGSDVERAKARAKDTDVDWREVPDSAIEKPDLRLNFLDPIGFRYYIPAYMIWEIRQSLEAVWRECNTRGAALSALRSGFNRELLSYNQSHAIYRFLHFYAEYGEDFEQDEAKAAIKEYWGKFR